MIARRSVLLIALAVLALGAVVRPVGAATARINLKPASGSPTSKVKVNGAGFGPTETVVITFDATRVVRATTDASGSFSTMFKVPASALPGGQAVVATGQTSGLTATASFTVQTNWSQLGFGVARTGFNPFENVIDISNVSGLATAWTGAAGGSSASTSAVANGVAYVGSTDGKLYAFDAAGVTNCSGSPKTCQPLWTSATGRTINSSPAVSNSVVYAGSEDGKLYAFDAAGVTNCSGTPKTCTPLWTSENVGIFGSSPAVAGGVVYVGSGTGPFGGTLFAFDAAGVTNCSGTPKTCAPLWTGVTTGKSILNSSPAVANDVVYIGSQTNHDGGFDAFDAAGVTNCSGTPTTCTPLWTATTGSISAGSPAVGNGEVYVSNENFNLFAFDAAGVTNCSGTPRTCTALWTSATKTVISSPAVANGVLYAGTFDGLEAYDAAGVTNCSGVSPKRCSPLWTGPASGLPIAFSPAVANGLVYAGAEDAKLYAFDAAGVTNCSGTPTTCAPVWTAADSGSLFLSPVVANGIVYVSAGDNLYAFSLP
jgi:outer membrane protein assembly factor BamB